MIGMMMPPRTWVTFARGFKKRKQIATVMMLEMMMTQTNEKVRSSLPLGGGSSMSGPGTMP